MNGCTIPYTPVAVDFWKVRQCPRVRLFFLSHVHLDQTCGITSSWSMPIYCSPLSKKLLLQRFQVNQDVVHALELNVPHIIPLTMKENVTMSVTLIDANHCPGSVMFLFEGYFGRILYTGDFRYTESMLTTLPFCDIVSKPIDVLYMDNTYCSPKCNFPVRDVAEREIITTIEQHPKKKIVIGLRNLGKEDLLISIASHFNETIKVSEERYKTLELLNAHEQFTVVDHNCRIEVVPLMQITRQNMDAWNNERPTIAILPTALFTALGYMPFHGQQDMIVVPYSDHSSYPELHRFVTVVKPKSIIPIVKADVRDPLTAALLDRTSVECFLDYLDKTPMTNYHIPAAVLELMNQTPSRNGSCRKVGAAARKSNSNAKIRKTSAKNQKENADVPRSSAASSSVTLPPLEQKPKETAVVDRSNCSSVEHQHLDNTHVKEADHQQHVQSAKSHSINTKLIRCASSDRLLSLHRPHMKLRAARVASPDLRMQLKWKAGADLKRLYMGIHSNLVRTRRVRLCNAHLCRTLCHNSKNDRCLSTSSSDTEMKQDEPILEMNRGEETMYRFTDEILREFRSISGAQENLDASNISAEMNSDSSSSISNSQQRERRLANNYSTAGSSPAFACHSTVVHDTSNTYTSPSHFVCTAAMEETGAIDLRNKGLIMSTLPPQHMIMTSSTASQICARSDLQSGNHLKHVRGNEIGDYMFRPSERDLQAVANSGFTSGPIRSSLPFADVGVAQRDQFSDYHFQSGMYQMGSERNGLVNKLPDPERQSTWNTILSHPLLTTRPSDMMVSANGCHTESGFTRQGQNLDTRSSFYSNCSTNDANRVIYNSSPPILVSYSPTEADQLRSRTSSIRRSSFPNGGYEPRASPNSDSHFDELVSERISEDSDETADSAENFKAKHPKLDSFVMDEDNADKTLCLSSKIALHDTNPSLESTLPPKKNWRHRFRQSQLHKNHPENTWTKLEANNMAKLLVTNRTNGNSRI